MVSIGFPHGGDRLLQHGLTLHEVAAILPDMAQPRAFLNRRRRPTAFASARMETGRA